SGQSKRDYPRYARRRPSDSYSGEDHDRKRQPDHSARVEVYVLKTVCWLECRSAPWREEVLSIRRALAGFRRARESQAGYGVRSRSEAATAEPLGCAVMFFECREPNEAISPNLPARRSRPSASCACRR